jgi:hypothetical protein
MSGKPTFKNNKFTLEFARGADGQVMELKASCWVNPKKDDRYDAAKNAACDQIRQLVIDNDLSFRVVFDHRQGDDYNNWPQVGAFNLFANTEFPGTQQPAAAPAQPAPGGFGSSGGFNNG